MKVTYDTVIRSWRQVLLEDRVEYLLSRELYISLSFRSMTSLFTSLEVEQVEAALHRCKLCRKPHW